MEKNEPSFTPPVTREEPTSSPGIPMIPLAWLDRMEESRQEERRVMEKLVQEQLAERKRERLGRNWFRAFIAAYCLLLVVLGYRHEWQKMLEDDTLSSSKHTALVDLRGPIMAESDYDADTVIENLQDAFKDKNTKGVILRINSPGGSPVQAGLINDEMVRLQKEYPTIPLYAVLEDLCASGGYYVAAAAREIYADKGTLVGSIGVIMRGFGFEETMRKVGVESRLITAGENKAFLDPFEPLKPEERQHAQLLLDKIHKQFIEVVQKGRGKRLRGDDTTLFNGLIWTGEEAVDLGIVDGLASTDWVARNLIHAEKTVEFTSDSDWMTRLSKQLASSAVSHLHNSLWMGQ